MKTKADPLEIVRDLAEHVQRQKTRSMERFFESGEIQDRDEAQRAIGAERILEEARKRLRYLDPGTPDWVKPVLEPTEPHLLFRQHRSEASSAVSTHRRRAGAAA